MFVPPFADVLITIAPSVVEVAEPDCKKIEPDCDEPLTPLPAINEMSGVPAPVVPPVAVGETIFSPRPTPSVPPLMMDCVVPEPGVNVRTVEPPRTPATPYPIWPVVSVAEPPATVDHVPSPRRYVVLFAVPVPRRAVPTVPVLKFVAFNAVSPAPLPVKEVPVTAPFSVIVVLATLKSVAVFPERAMVSTVPDAVSVSFCMSMRNAAYVFVPSSGAHTRHTREPDAEAVWERYIAPAEPRTPA